MKQNNLIKVVAIYLRFVLYLLKREHDKIKGIGLRPYLLVVVLLFFLSACGEKPGIHGLVIDSGGKGLAGVSISIPNSAFKCITDQRGHYYLDFAPGSFKVLYAKDHYTSHELELNLTQKTYFPADTVKLYPIPEGQGVYWLDGAQTTQLKSVVVRQHKWSQSWPLRNFQTCFIEIDENLATALSDGRAEFIDTHPQAMRLAKISPNGTIESFSYSFSDTHFDYQGMMSDKMERVGKERLTLRSIDVDPGLYAWTPVYQTLFGEVHVQAGKPAFLFKIKAIDGSESGENGQIGKK